MAYYVFLMTDSERCNMHAGYCGHLEDMIAFYKLMPSMAMDENYIQNILVYLEQAEHEQMVKDRLKQIVALNRIQKEDLINTINPDWVELMPGVNIEL